MQQKLEAIAFTLWKESLNKKGFPKNPDGSWMNIWELYNYWETQDKTPWIEHAKRG